ncbi:MAG TPA: TCR/Tet family MFS transporter [Usitatibacter sp.]|jgi:MFS transporter, DHA1 family, tetracycline resistance protein|nr:TCR/Tet family MFS transporter [Usitatibacter sp.]
MRKATVAFIFALVVMDVVALGIVIPVLPKLVESFMGGDTARASGIYGAMTTAWGVMQFLAMPVVGMLSDRFGRRPVILISCLGLGLDYFVMALAPNVGWLFVGRVLSGATSANFSTAFAYIADVTPQEKRAGAFGMMGAAFGVGFVVGPALGGLLGGIDPRLPFWVAGSLALLNAAYGLFVLPESLPPGKRAGFAWSRANPVGSLKLLRSHRELFGLAAALFLMDVAHFSLPAISVLYMGYRYGWGPPTVGAVLAAVGVGAMIVQGGLVRRVVPRIGERRALAVGLFFGALGFFIYGLAPTGAIFLAGVAVMALWGFAMPSAQALMSRHVGVSEQGQLQGANASLMSLAGILGPLLFTQIFAATLDRIPSAAFVLAGALLLVAMMVAWRSTRANP